MSVKDRMEGMLMSAYTALNLNIDDNEELMPKFKKGSEIRVLDISDSVDGLEEKRGETNGKFKLSFLNGYSKKKVDSIIKELEEDHSKIQMNWQQQIQDLLDEHSGLVSECTILREQLKDAETDIEEVEQIKIQVEDLLVENKKLRTDLEKKQEQCKMIEYYAQEIEDKYNKIQNTLPDKNATKELSDLKSELAKLENHCNELESQLSRRQKENDFLNSEIIQIREQSKSYLGIEDNVKLLTEENKKLKQLLEDNTDKYEKSRQQINELKYKLENKEEEITKMKEKTNLAENKQLQIDIMQEEVEMLREDNKALRLNINKLKIYAEQQKLSEEQCKLLESKFSDLKRNYDFQIQKLTVLEKENLQMELKSKSLENIKYDYDNLFVKLNDIEVQNKNLKSMIFNYEKNEKQYVEMENNTKKYQQELFLLKMAVQDIIKKVEVQASEYKRLTEKLETCELKLEDEIREKSLIELKNEELTDNIVKLYDQLSFLEKENYELRNSSNHVDISSDIGTNSIIKVNNNNTNFNSINMDDMQNKYNIHNVNCSYNENNDMSIDDMLKRAYELILTK